MVVGGANARPPAFGAANAGAARNGPNVRPGKAINTKSSALGGPRNGSVDEDGDSRMGVGGAAAHQA